MDMEKQHILPFTDRLKSNPCHIQAEQTAQLLIKEAGLSLKDEENQKELVAITLAEELHEALCFTGGAINIELLRPRSLRRKKIIRGALDAFIGITTLNIERFGVFPAGPHRDQILRNLRHTNQMLEEMLKQVIPLIPPDEKAAP
jgi:hypothetical protein